ncbi:MAG: hydantoinase/oxoprolinase family protein [Betaproteobacteria bacterium]|nr:hydantoinase/oxoprolinase family protein [Betaproteobacteria bacterium]
MKKYVVGIDVGGTFTDAVIYNEVDSTLHRTKVLTTAGDQSIGVLKAFQEFYKDLDIDSTEIRRFNHGYTVGINAALTRTGAKTGLLCTKGHREKLDSGGLDRPFDVNTLYNPYWQRPHQIRPIVPRRYRREIAERIREDGSVILSLSEEDVRREVEFLRSEGVESISICFINSYLAPKHEERVKEIVQEIFPEAYVQTSQIHPVAGELKRTWIVTLDAYCGPAINTYLQRLKFRMNEEISYNGEIFIMQMGGGLRTVETIVQAPVNTLQSGPVAGMLGSEYYSRSVLGGKDLVCFDVGGTSTDIGLVKENKADVTTDWELENSIPCGIPAVDVRSIGAGGGSLIIVDEMGSLRVGPESAGSKPGPACYRLGGIQPAVTDACVAMGLIQSELFLDGKMKLDKSLAIQALKNVGDKINMDPITLAQGAYEIVTLNIAEAIDKMLISKGLHPKGFSLMAFGAAGPMFAVNTARELSIPEVVVPYFPGGFAALGMLTSRLKAEHAMSPMEKLDAIGPDRLNALYKEIEESCIKDLEYQGVARKDIKLERIQCGMYQGQSWDQRVSVPVETYTEMNFHGLRKAFDDYYDTVFGYKAEEIPIFLTTIGAIAYGPEPKIQLPQIAAGTEKPPSDAIVFHRELFLDRKTYKEAPFYDRFKLKAGNQIHGPAVIDDHLSTIVVNEGAVASVDSYGNLIIKV